jgi:hypothetical protein
MMENIYIQMFTRCLRFLPPDELGSPTRIQLCVVLAAVTVRGGPSPPGQCPGHACGVFEFFEAPEIKFVVQDGVYYKIQNVVEIEDQKT